MVRKSRRLSRRLTAIGLAIVASLAFAGLAAGSASALSVSGLTTHSGSGGALMYTPEKSFTHGCSSSSSTGNTTSSTTGEITLTFFGCKTQTQIGTVVCTGPGMATGSFKATLQYKLVYLDDAKTKPGLILIPPGAQYYPASWAEQPEPMKSLANQVIPGTGTVASMSCMGAATTWNGAFLAKIASPGLKVPTKTAKLEFGTAAGGHIAGVPTNGYEFTEYQSGESKGKVALTASQTWTSATTFELQP